MFDRVLSMPLVKLLNLSSNPYILALAQGRIQDTAMRQ